MASFVRKRLKKNHQFSFYNLCLTFQDHSMTDSQDTPGLGRVIDLPVNAGTSTQPEFQQLINQVQFLIQAVLAT